MMLKAGLIVAVFMHMAWERLALIYAIILPPVLVLVFVAMMVFESDYTLWTRHDRSSGPSPDATRNLRRLTQRHLRRGTDAVLGPLCLP